MAPTLESLGIDKLSIDDRTLLAHAIWDSIEAETGIMPDWHWDIIEKRLEAADADSNSGKTWAELRKELSGSADSQ